ncbi:endonuclease MutS2 [Natranaerobius trueperi]|uniref:endonuclease MutS2 n=1 Tax=Natranaerobius trueperi TaxID=759412 RepID=UPI001303912C|nr:endonuclease MutS2 [Natranaerobius trueperi]
MAFKKSEKTLELNKVIDMLKEETMSDMTKEICETLKPSTNYSEVSTWLKETTEARNLLAEKELFLRGLKDIRKQLQFATKDGVLQGNELFDIKSVISTSERVKKLFDEYDENYPIIFDLINKLPNLTRLRKELESKIDEDGEVKDSASSNLKNIRMRVKNLRSQVKSSLNKTLNSSEKYLQEKLVTMRNDRYVLPIKAEYQNMIPGIIHDQSASGMTVYIEPRDVVEKNNQLNQAKREEYKEIQKILKELSEQIKEHYDPLQNTLQILVELDFILSKGALSRKLNAREPELNYEKRINIFKARHPLLGEEAVPIDVKLGDDFNTLVITGPNTGGKTVTLKMVGLFTLMTQLGLHLPAGRGTEMGIFEKVFADIGDEQDIEQSLSTFSSHMSNIVEIVNNVDEKSLILLDELGAGTDPTEGSALAMSLLEYFHNKGCRSIATTHYTQLKNFAHARDGVENASVEFDDITLKPTYKLLIGVPGKSNAFVISSRLGLSDDIISNAKSFLADEEIEVEDLISSLTEKEKSTQLLKDELEREKAKVERMKSELEKAKQDMENKRDEVLNKAREQAEDIITDARRDVEETLKEARKLAEKNSQKEMAEVSGNVRKRLSEKQEHLQESMKSDENKEPLSPAELRQGMDVYVSNLDKEGIIQKINKDKKEAEVQVGIMKVSVAFSNLYLVEDKENSNGSEIEKHKRKSVLTDKKANISTELDIRGERVDDAIAKVDKFLDDAIVTNLTQIRIIHGKGTGNLRKGIQFHLEGHPHVNEYRIGSRNEGGEGVTVVKLNL